MSLNRLRLLSCWLVFVFFPVAHAERTWTEVRSPHFRVLTDASGKDARRVAIEFEQMRQVFALRFNDDHLESGAPLTIVAMRNVATFKEFDALRWKESKGNIAGEFLSDWEKQFAVVRLNTWDDRNSVVVDHQYTHTVPSRTKPARSTNTAVTSPAEP